MHKGRILLGVADRLAQKSLYEMLCRNDYQVDIAESLKKILSLLEENSYHTVLADIKDNENIELLNTAREKKLPTDIIIFTTYGNIEIAVESIKLGAFDCLVKPVEDKKILSALERSLAGRPNPENKTFLISDVNKKENPHQNIIGESRPMKEIYSIINRIAGTKATVLLRGESGTGKRLIAHALHQADKKRKSKPFVEISCGALPKEIIESELFGHTKGSFTGAINDRKGRFEFADGGIILLDDIDCLPLDLQVKLLRILQHKEFERVGDNKTVRVDVRIVVSTNHDLEKAVANKTFREDVYYRLNVISIHVPPLRERKEDIPLLVEHFINIYSKENHKNIKEISRDVLGMLVAYSWPGNVRQLENIIERAVILDMDSVIGKEDLPQIISDSAAYISKDAAAALSKEENSSLKDALKDPEKIYILRILEETNWNKKKAARRLGVNRTTLYNKLKKYNIFSNNLK